MKRLLIPLVLLGLPALVVFATMAKADPALVGDDGGAPLTLQKLADDGTVENVPVMFNPAEIQVKKSVPWQRHHVKGRDAPTLEFTNATPLTLSVELFFDTYEKEEDVRDYVATLLDLAQVTEQKPSSPPQVLLTWGEGLRFKGVVESVGVKYTLFLPNGRPVRAAVQLELVEFDRGEERREKKK